MSTSITPIRNWISGLLTAIVLMLGSECANAQYTLTLHSENEFSSFELDPDGTFVFTYEAAYWVDTNYVEGYSHGIIDLSGAVGPYDMDDNIVELEEGPYLPRDEGSAEFLIISSNGYLEHGIYHVYVYIYAWLENSVDGTDDQWSIMDTTIEV